MAIKSDHSGGGFRVVHTIAGTRCDHGGTSRSVPSTVDALSEAQVDCHLVTGLPADAGTRSNLPRDVSCVSTFTESRFWGRLGTGNRFAAMVEAQLISGRQNLIHDHGMWLPSNRSVARLTNGLGVKRIVAPRGMASEWSMAHGRVKKQLAWRLFQENALLTAAAFHATATQELDDIRRLGFRQPVAVIPNGLELPQKMPDRVIGDHRTALFLSRIHPKKGLINLVRAWARSIATAAPGSAEPWRLEIAGPDERGHRAEVQSEVNRLGLRQVVSFSGSMDDREKWQAMVNADLFVLPTFSENFGIVVAEALVAGLPVITTTGTPWQLIRDRRLGWWIEPTEDALAETLRTAFEMPAASLGEMGECARRYAEQQFKWNQVASQLGQFYEWLLSGGERPDFVFD